MQNNKKLLSLITGIAAVSMSVVFSTTAYASKPTTNRFFGANRYATNISIINNGWSEASNVIIASGENYPDALSAAPFAKKKNAPIMLVEKSGLSSDQIKQLTNLKTKNVYIIGGTGVVSSNVETQLGKLGITVTRIAGSNRYETSAKIAQEVGTENGVVVASGENFPDALSIAPIAAAKGMPILLSSKDSLPESTKSFLKDKNVPVTYIIGGTGVLSGNVNASLSNAKRLYGKNRYETNISVIKQFENSIDFTNVYVASGENFPDTLSGSVFASNSRSPIALVESAVPTVSSDYLKTKNIKNINLLGGLGAVGQSVENTLRDTMKYLAIKKVDNYSDYAFINENYHFPSKLLRTSIGLCKI